MLLCVFMVWPTKFLQSLWIMCKLNLLLENLWRMQNFVFGNIGLKILVWKIISSHTHAFLFLNFNALSQFKKLCFSSKIWWASAWFDRSILFFDRSKFLKIFKIWERESLSVSTDRGWFSTDRNSWIRFFKKVELDFFKPTFQMVLFFSLSPLWLLAPPINFCRFPSRFLQGFCP